MPQDGWELIKYDMGFNENGTPKTTPVGYVHLVLYNKFTGVLRVLVAGDRPHPFNGAKIEIKYASGTISSALSNSSKLFALDKFEASPSIASVSEYNNNNGRWFYGDFQIGYDPCTCIYESSMVIQIRLINESKIDLSGSIFGSLTPKLTDITNGAGTVDEDKYSFSPKDLLDYAKKAQKSYKEVSKFVSEQEKAAGIQPNTPLTGEQTKKKGDLNFFQEALKKSSFLKAGLKAAPYVAGAVELVNFFVGGGKKTASPQEVKITPMALNASINLKGTLQASYLYGDITFYTPGSKDSQIKNPVDYPYYNEVLGVFNLIETPKMAVRTIINHSEEGTYGTETYFKGDHEESVLQLLKSSNGTDLSFVLNPASGFISDNIEILGNIEFGYDYEYSSGIPNSPYFEKILETGYLPLSSLTSVKTTFGYSSEESFYGSFYSQLGCITDLPAHARLRLLINLQRVDADVNTQNVLFLMTYPIEMINNNSYNFTGTEYCSIEQNIILENTSINQSLSAWNTITIGPNVTFPPNPNITIKAGQGVHVLPGVTIPPGVTIKTDYPISCPITLSQATSSTISNFCNLPVYSQAPGRALRSGRQEGPEVKSEDESDKLLLEVYPNPAHEHITFQYTVEIESMVSLNILDVSGRIIATPVNEFQSAGVHEVNYDISNLKAGVYIYTLNTNQGKRTKRLVVFK